MSIRSLSDADASELRALLAELGYEESRLTAQCGLASPPTRADIARFMHETRAADALAVLARVFLGGIAAPGAAARRAWPARLVELCVDAGLLEAREGLLVPAVLIVPRGTVLLASDALVTLGGSQARDFVPPASTHAAGTLLNLTIRERLTTALDLGTGCGVQALAAAAHCEHVVAVDINPRATAYAEFNARLNGFANVECRTGDFFGPVEDQRFDLVVSNPPFVPGPHQQFTYRDSDRELDEVCRDVARQAAAHLNDGGYCQMLCEWVEVEGEPWRQRIEGWLDGLGCDAWVLSSPPRAPADYARIRLAEVTTSPGQGAGQEYAEWLEYFEARRVVAVHAGAFVLRRRSGRNWLHFHPLAQDVTEPAGAAVLASLAACDFVAAHEDEQAFLATTLAPAKGLSVKHEHAYRESAWKAGPIRASLPGPLAMEAELDPATAALIADCDGKRPVAECLARLAADTGADRGALTSAALPALRLLVERGLLVGAAA